MKAAHGIAEVINFSDTIIAQPERRAAALPSVLSV